MHFAQFNSWLSSHIANSAGSWGKTSLIFAQICEHFGTRFLVVFWVQADAMVVIKTMAGRLILIRRSVVIAEKARFWASRQAVVSQAVVVALNVPAGEIAHNFQSTNFEGC